MYGGLHARSTSSSIRILHGIESTYSDQSCTGRCPQAWAFRLYVFYALCCVQKYFLELIISLSSGHRTYQQLFAIVGSFVIIWQTVQLRKMNTMGKDEFRKSRLDLFAIIHHNILKFFGNPSTNEDSCSYTLVSATVCFAKLANEEFRCKTRYTPNLKNRDFSIIRKRDVSRIQWSQSFLSKRALSH